MWRIPVQQELFAIAMDETRDCFVGVVPEERAIQSAHDPEPGCGGPSGLERGRRGHAYDQEAVAVARDVPDLVDRASEFRRGTHRSVGIFPEWGVRVVGKAGDPPDIAISGEMMNLAETRIGHSDGSVGGAAQHATGVKTLHDGGRRGSILSGILRLERQTHRPGIGRFGPFRHRENMDCARPVEYEQRIPMRKQRDRLDDFPRALPESAGGNTDV